MRLNFWEETISKIFNKNSKKPAPKGHPVVEELVLAMNRSKFTKRYFERIINSRKIANINFISLKQMEQYAEDTVSTVNYLVLEALNCRNTHADHAASHLGKAQGITNLLRSIYSQKSNQHLPIPQELLIKVRTLINFIARAFFNYFIFLSMEFLKKDFFELNQVTKQPRM